MSSKKQRKTSQYTADSLMEFIDIIKRICVHGGRYLFRGQLESDKLMPSVFRPAAKIEYKKKGIEAKMLDDFKRRGRPFISIEPQSECEWLALSQHHGMPTRFLDWTSSALAALWFTVSDTRQDKKNDNGIIWALSFNDNKKEVVTLKEADKPFEIKIVKIIRPRHIERRFVAQGGFFTIHPNNTPLEKSGFKKKLTKILVPRKQFDDIRFLVNVCGTNQVSLFPDFDGLCKHIAWQNSKEYRNKRDKSKNN